MIIVCVYVYIYAHICIHARLPTESERQRERERRARAIRVTHTEQVKNRTEFREKYGHLLSSARNVVGAVQMPFLRDPNTGKDILEPLCRMKSSLSCRILSAK